MHHVTFIAAAEHAAVVTVIIMAFVLPFWRLSARRGRRRTGRGR